MMENPLLWEVFCGLLTCVLLGNEKKSMKSANNSNFCANFARLKAPSNINGLYTPFNSPVNRGTETPKGEDQYNMRVRLNAFHSLLHILN